MAREIDEAWIDEAIERYRRLEQLLAEFDKRASGLEVTVRSPDGLVEVVVTGDGTIRDVAIADEAQGRSVRDLARSVRSAVTAAGDAARWARAKLHQETFGELHPLPADPGDARSER